MTRPTFTAPDAWAGGSYDLAIELGPRDNARLTSALRAVWASPDLDGCYEHRDREPAAQLRREVGTLSLDAPLHGLARIGEGPAIVCRTVVVRYSDDGDDWLYLCLPMASLAGRFDVGAFPFDDGTDLAWRATVDAWLCGIAQPVFAAAPFRLALVGWDGGDSDEAATVHRSGVPDERWVGYLVPEAGALAWFAPNRSAPMTMDGT